jgi:arsenate reductase
MAEGFARQMLPKNWQVFSAGVRADGMNKYAMKVMKEVGVDISKQYSKTLDDIRDAKPDVVITLCDNAKQSCPAYLDAVIGEHWGLEDPADAEGSEEEILKVYREIRNEIKERIERYVLSIGMAC